ncbi:MAG TPA: type II restriction endonuclease [Planctomycetaceae bacterium]|nr:type II restriction endonuclease [Planctomycetaceae bacterium]
MFVTGRRIIDWIEGLHARCRGRGWLLVWLVAVFACTFIDSSSCSAQTSKQAAVESKDAAELDGQTASRAAEIQRGSKTAKAGFENEDQIREKLNAWRSDQAAQAWLSALGYDNQELVSVQVHKPHGQKADLMLNIDSKKRGACQEGISIKLVSNPNGFNQIDKRWLHDYAQTWQMPDDVHAALKRFVGELRPEQVGRDARRTFLDEMPKETQQAILQFFSTNRQRIINYLFEGSGDYSADWLMVTIKPPRGEAAQKKLPNFQWIIVPTAKAAEFYGQGEVVISREGSLKIGRITMQRKGGDNGRHSANMLQFKINPVEIFEMDR